MSKRSITPSAISPSIGDKSIPPVAGSTRRKRRRYGSQTS